MKLNRQKYKAGPQYVKAQSSEENPNTLPEKNDSVNTKAERKKQTKACLPGGHISFKLNLSILLNYNTEQMGNRYSSIYVTISNMFSDIFYRESLKFCRLSQNLH